jgi:hypothetical protein
LENELNETIKTNNENKLILQKKNEKIINLNIELNKVNCNNVNLENILNETIKINEITEKE